MRLYGTVGVVLFLVSGWTVGVWAQPDAMGTTLVPEGASAGVVASPAPTGTANATNAALTPPPVAATPEVVATPQPTPVATPVKKASKAVLDRGSEMLLFEEIKVTVASQEAESLSEAPVITSVISAEEIKRMGARTLNDVLDTLPGFSHIQDHNELYSAERGIYASSQQKIMVLRDGHRLNSRSYSEANFDYAISLDNVEHIEVMRGPGGSTYGDVALTAVVNIVTKDPKATNATEVKLGVGNYLQKKAAVVSAYDLKDLGSFLLSGTIYQNEGQMSNSADWPDMRRPNDAGGSVLYGFRRPAYDLYLKYDWNDLGVKASRRYAQYIEPRTGGGVSGIIYDLDKYALTEGETPGLSSLFEHYELSYAPTWAGYEWTTRVYYDGFKVNVNIAVNNGPLTQSMVQWAEWVGGARSQVAKNYELFGTGTALVGVQVETMEVYSSIFASGVNPNLATPGNPALSTGKEWTYSGFAQLKHKFLENVILNLGTRYDYKKRREDPAGVITIDDVSQVSPRAALMYALNEEFDFRLSYGHCFVDAPYWYRYNNLAGYTGAKTLKPETMNSYQFTVEEKLWEQYLTHQINFFYNDFSNVVYRDAAMIYSNAGTVKSNGIEYEIAYKQPNLSTRLNYTFQQFTEVSGLASRWGQMENVPEHMGNLMVDYAPLCCLMEEPWAKALWLNVGLRYVGKQFARWDKKAADPRDTVDSVVLCNAGITAGELLPGLSIGVHAYNLLNQTWFQGGSVEYPYLQPGRWFMGEVSYTF